MNEAADNDPTRDLPHAFGGPLARGLLRVANEDFVVHEQLGYAADGDGQHVFLQIEKRGLNTHDVARQLARAVGGKQMQVGYAGLKDRHAVTRQAFSVDLAGAEEPDWASLNNEQITVLSAERHRRKIRRGSLRGNRFELRIRKLSGELDRLAERLTQIAARGVPNYFGPQRFGRNGGNVPRARALLAGQLRVKREQRGMLLSAARSLLFNRVLAERVRRDCWDGLLAGDVMLLDGSERQFAAAADDTELAQRLKAMDIHPSGPLCGRPSRSLEPADEAAALESAALADEAELIDGLQRAGLDADRRALRLPVRELDWQLQGDDLYLSFALPSGSYATTVLRELVEVEDVSITPRYASHPG